MRFQSGRLSVFCLFIAVTAPVRPALAQTAYEGFELTFPDYDGGNGLTGNWQQGGFNAFAANYGAAETSLSFNGLQTSGGRIVGAAFPTINGAIRNLAQPIGTDNTTLYLSLLVRPLGTLNQGVFNGFFGMTLGGSANELFVGKPGGGLVESYVVEQRGGSGQISSGVPTVVGQTTLLVVRAEFLLGNDLFTLHVNPNPGYPEPTNGVMKSDLDLGMLSRLGIYSTGAFAIDEIRIGATYADVTPKVPFAGTPGNSNCKGKSVSVLAQQYRGLTDAASALGYVNVAALQDAITSFCAT